MNIYERIEQDHKKHRDLMEKIADTSGDTEERRKWFKELMVDVKGHANAEEQAFYSVLLEENDSQEQARHSVAEHKDTNDLFDELDEMDMSNPHWLPKFKELRHDLEHHMEEEEEDVFSMARKIVDDKRAVELTEKFNARKEQELKEIEEEEG